MFLSLPRAGVTLFSSRPPTPLLPTPLLLWVYSVLPILRTVAQMVLRKAPSGEITDISPDKHRALPLVALQFLAVGNALNVKTH